MLFKLLGFNFEPKEVRDRHTIDDVMYSNEVETISLPRRVTQSSYFQSITWPNPEDLDEFDQLKFCKLVEEFVGQLDKSDGWFDICTVTSIVELFDLKLPLPAKKAKEKLRKLHCVHYPKMPPEIRAAIPKLLSIVFTEGRCLKGTDIRVRDDEYHTPDEVVALISYDGKPSPSDMN